MSKKRYLEAEMLKEFLRMGMKVGHIHTLRDVENYIDTQPEATPQEVAGQCWRNSKYDPLTDSEESLFGEPRSSTLTSHIGRMQFFTLWTFRSGCRCL